MKMVRLLPAPNPTLWIRGLRAYAADLISMVAVKTRFSREGKRLIKSLVVIREITYIFVRGREHIITDQVGYDVHRDR